MSNPGMKRQRFNSSLSLVHKNNEKLALNEAALDILCDLDGPIAVCVCVGQYRSGKSFLLNKLATFVRSEEPIIFQVGHSQNNCTKGLWINSDIKKTELKNGFVNLIFVDSEVNYLLHYILVTYK